MRLAEYTDYALRVLSLSGLSLPSFWLGLLILMAFVSWFDAMPIYTDRPDGFWHSLLLFSVPGAAVGFRSSALVMRLTRSSMLEVLRQDYIRTARAKGLPERTVIRKHALRAGLTPIVTAAGLDLAILLGGAIVTESVFTLPGIGRLAIDSVLEADLPVITATVLVAGAFIVIANVVVDLLYAVIDPRVRLV